MIDLYTTETPNGHKISIMLEELGLDYEPQRIDLTAGEQKEDWFLQINPNGRIPAIIDRGNDDLTLAESGAILIYLAEKTGQLLPASEPERSKVIQWVMFQMSGVGPMQGQAHVFIHYGPDDQDLSWGKKRYIRETRRLYEVLDRRLGEQDSGDYLVGDYSIADIATYPWVRSHRWASIPLEGLDNLQGWMETMSERPAVQKGLDVPVPQEELDSVPEEDAEELGKSIVEQ